MADRFINLFQTQSSLYCEGAPVVVSAGVLLRDTDTGCVVAQLKFQSVSEKKIKALKVALMAFDVSGKPLQGVSDYQYLELNISQGQSFGSNKAIVMPVEVTRSFAIDSIVAVFDDSSTWENDAPFSALPPIQQLQQRLDDPELEKQYRIETTPKSKYVPQEANGVWQCACGLWNGTETCTQCGVGKAEIFDALNIDALTQQMNLRLMQEEQQRAEEAAREAALQAERDKQKRRAKKMAIIAGTVVALAVGSIALYTKLTALTIEKLIALRAKEDVVALLGSGESRGYCDSYDVEFLGHKFEGDFYYNEDELEYWRLAFVYPELLNTEDLSGIDVLRVESAASSAANPVYFDVLKNLTVEYGASEIVEHDCGCLSTKWIVGDRMIKLNNYSEHLSHGSNGSVVEIRVNCDLQSFCKHKFEETQVVEATCQKDGYHKKTCTICGYEEKEELKSMGHSFVRDETAENIEPTCTELGSAKYICTICGYQKEEIISAMGHDMIGATCTSPSMCSICSYTEGDALGHTGSIGTCGRCGERLSTNPSISQTSTAVNLTLEKLQGIWRREEQIYNDYYDFTGYMWEEITVNGTAYREEYQITSTPELVTTVIQEGVITSIEDSSFTVVWTYGCTNQSDGTSWQPSIDEPSTYPVSKISDNVLVFTVYPYYKQ